jgi:hypothetical protein
MEFEVFTKEVEINGQKYKLRPLSGRHLPKLFNVIKKIEVNEGSTNNEAVSSFLSKIDEETIQDLHSLGLETLKKSYPNSNQETLDEFVTQNLFKLFEAITQVNIPHQDESE